MNKLSKFIVKHRLLISIVVSVLVIISIATTFFVRLNSDLISYLPKNMPTKQGLDFLVKNFGMQGDATLGVNGFDQKDMEYIVSEIKKIPAVRQEGGVMWYGAILNMIDSSSAGALVAEDIKNNETLKNVLHPKLEGDDRDKCYIAMIFLSVPSASNEASGALNKIEDIVTKYAAEKGITDYEFKFGGSSSITRDIFNSVFGEIWKFFLVGLLVVFIILLLTTTSIVEPFILLLTLGISIILNMGSNIIFGEISTVTMSISAILQLGLSMDYAIFLIHAFYQEKETCPDDYVAMQRAIPKTFLTVFSSALTTVFGFIALFFMQFTMGADLGKVLAKGVFLSMLTVLFVQPCLILIYIRPLEKYSHRILVPKFENTASQVIKKKGLIILVAVLLIIPAMIMQSKVEYSYMDMGLANPNPTRLEKHVNTIGNTVIAAVPVEEGQANLDHQRKFTDDLLKINNVKNVMGLYSMLPRGNIVIDGFVSRNLTSSNIFTDMVKKDEESGKYYTIYSIMLDGGLNPESEYAGKVFKEINDSIRSHFDGQKVYTTGTSQSVQDLAQITPNDFLIVSIVSILSIFIVLLFTLRSFRVSLLLIAVIELGIFINIALCYITKTAVNFMAYIVISAVQLGATVDYAILYTVTYKRNKTTLPASEAAYKATRSTSLSILTSASIIAGACFSVSIIAKNLIMKQLTMLIGRGAIISAILVLVLLPACLIAFSKNVKIKAHLRRIGKRAGPIERLQIYLTRRAVKRQHKKELKEIRAYHEKEIE